MTFRRHRSFSLILLNLLDAFPSDTQVTLGSFSRFAEVKVPLPIFL